jgi:hypothetical protein
MNTYLIQLAGKINMDDLNQLSPYLMSGILVKDDTTRFKVCADQSGLLGMLRFLHNHGLVLLAVRQVA